MITCIQAFRLNFFIFIISLLISSTALLRLPVEAKASISQKQFTDAEREFLIQTFKAEGFEEHFLKSVFNQKRMVKIPVAVWKNVENEDRAAFYEDFLSPYSIGMAYRFSKRWKTALSRASSKYQVDKEVLIAILLVETGLGNFLGNYPVISVFSSLITEDRRLNHQNRNTENALGHRQKLARLKEKALWAKSELSALLQIAEITQKNIFSFRGSYAGAFGIPQFLPSSYLKWGIDSDNNGVVNLFLFPDAIHSTANYLKSHGWKKGLYLESNKDVIWQYNQSQNYVNTVLKVAWKLNKYHQQKIASLKEKTKQDS